MKNYHYTYLLIGLDRRFYIGVRSCECLPEEDKYMGSFKDKTFKPISKHIQQVFETREEAITHEIELHNKFEVALDNNFANKAKQTSVKFDLRWDEEKRLNYEKVGRYHSRKYWDAPGSYEKASEKMQGSNNPFYGKKHTEEYKKRSSELQGSKCKVNNVEYHSMKEAHRQTNTGLTWQGFRYRFHSKSFPEYVIL